MPAAISSAVILGPEYRGSSLSGRSQISVSIGPGLTSRILIPLSHRSTAVASLHPHNANLLAEYAASLALPRRPATLDTLTIIPSPRAVIFGNRAIIMRAGARKLTRITHSRVA